MFRGRLPCVHERSSNISNLFFFSDNSTVSIYVKLGFRKKRRAVKYKDNELDTKVLQHKVKLVVLYTSGNYE